MLPNGVTGFKGHSCGRYSGRAVVVAAKLSAKDS
jgi:hypothetical protein